MFKEKPEPNVYLLKNVLSAMYHCTIYFFTLSFENLRNDNGKSLTFCLFACYFMYSSHV